MRSFEWLHQLFFKSGAAVKPIHLYIFCNMPKTDVALFDFENICLRMLPTVSQKKAVNYFELMSLCNKTLNNHRNMFSGKGCTILSKTIVLLCTTK